MLEFPRWKYILVACVMLFALVFAAPNFFGDDLAVQVARRDRANIDAVGQSAVETVLKAKHVQLKRAFVDEGRLMLLFDEVNQQLAARDAINETLSERYISALAHSPRAPGIFRKLGLRPMPLGLDLRGGLYLLYEVDVNGAISQLVESYDQDFRRALTTAKINFSDTATHRDSNNAIDGVHITFAAGTDLSAAREVLRKVVPDATFTIENGGPVPYVDATLTAAQIGVRQKNAIQQNMVTLRNRVAELRVTDPEVRQQGADRISVSLPGVLNSAEVKDILGKVATLEFRLTDTVSNVQEAVAKGRAPLGSRLEYHREVNGIRRPTLLKREIIATGAELVDATATTTQEGPGVAIRLNSKAGDEMLRVTQANLGKPMGVVLQEQTREPYTDADGVKKERTHIQRDVINEATIRGVFSNSFNITHLGQQEAQETALLMRSGQLAAPLVPVSERAIGPSLGQKNITAGVRALLIGSAALFLFMIFYYHLFGVVASVVLLGNVVLLTALLSLVGGSLSLPGIAGILLTVGMAVDANVIIYERIREELRNKVSPQTSIRAGFDKAWSAIFDSNLTTFIAGLVLWVFGTGPIRNFAVVLVLGIVTSVFTAMLGSRALLTLIYGGRHKSTKLSIG